MDAGPLIFYWSDSCELKVAKWRTGNTFYFGFDNGGNLEIDDLFISETTLDYSSIDLYYEDWDYEHKKN